MNILKIAAVTVIAAGLYLPYNEADARHNGYIYYDSGYYNNYYPTYRYYPRQYYRDYYRSYDYQNYYYYPDYYYYDNYYPSDYYYRGYYYDQPSVGLYFRF